MENITPEIHIFLIYNKARTKEKEIIKRIQDKFTILEIYEIEWNKNNFVNNIERFYCEKLRKKVRDSGKGKFLVITVKDENPNYCYTQTLRREEYVNSNVLYLKQELRKLTSPSENKIIYNVHSTNDIKEADHNLIFLLGSSYEEYYNYAINKKFDGNFVQLKREPFGAKGWNSFAEIFKMFNSTFNYVALQNITNETACVDILTNNTVKAVYLLNGKYIYKNSTKQVRIKIGEKDVTFNLRTPYDNFICEKWAKDILASKILNKDNIYTPNETDFKNLSVYRSIFHKTTPENKIEDIDRCIKSLYDYMEDNDYFPTKPKDTRIEYTPDGFEKAEFVERLKHKYKFENIESLPSNQNSKYKLFFRADYNGEKVFIKYGNSYAEKEYAVSNIYYKQNSQYFPKEIMYRTLKDNKMFIVTKYVEGQPLSEDLIKNSSVEKQNKMFDSLYEIAEIFYKNKFPIRNIKPKNFIAEYDGIIKFTDFKYFIGLRFNEEDEFLYYPPAILKTNTQIRKTGYIWDDMYAFYTILKTFPKENINDYDKKLSKLKSKIGKQKYYFFYNSFPIISYLNYKPLLFHKVYNMIAKPIRKLFR